MPEFGVLGRRVDGFAVAVAGIVDEVADGAAVDPNDIECVLLAVAVVAGVLFVGELNALNTVNYTMSALQHDVVPYVFERRGACQHCTTSLPSCGTHDASTPPPPSSARALLVATTLQGGLHCCECKVV